MTQSITTAVRTFHHNPNSKTSFACDIVFPTYPRITSPRDIERLYVELLKERENKSITEEMLI
jgi:hypothetical protein